MRLGKLNISFGREAPDGGREHQPVDPVAAGSVLRGYGPLAAFGILFILMAGFVPSIDDRVQTAGSVAPGGAYQPPAAGGAGGPGGDGTNGTGGPAVGSGETASPASSGGGTNTSGNGGGSTNVAPQEGRGEGSCAGRELQVPGNPYSPPCMEFPGGDNGGATSRGVTETEVRIAARMINERGFQQTLAAIAGAEIVDTPDDIKRTIKAFEDFFNQNYQFWGRKMNIIFHNGTSSNIEELQGRNQAEAQVDAKTVAQEIKAFAELIGATEPYIRSLAGQGVIGIGTPYLSRDWHVQYRPYAWSFFTDCSIVAETAAEIVTKMLQDKKAVFAGDALKDKNRKYGGLSPENDWYQDCHNAHIDIVTGAGYEHKRVNYKLDINSMSNQAANVVAQFKNAGVTSILCGCDPIFPVFLTAKAAEQNYEPEWIHIGTAFTDIDIVGQLYDQEQWSHAFGVSALGSPRPVRGGLGYSAYKSVRDDEPAFSVELIFGSMMILATGMQMAGPNLTPETFEQGLFNWPGGTGPYGTWGFGPGNYTPTRDYRVTYWHPDSVSIENNKAGAYLEAFGGKRYPPGQLPTIGKDEQPPVLHLDPNYPG